MVKDHSDREKGMRFRHIGYSYRLTARVLLYASSHRQDNTYHGLCYTSRGALAGTRKDKKENFLINLSYIPYTKTYDTKEGNVLFNDSLNTNI